MSDGGGDDNHASSNISDGMTTKDLERYIKIGDIDTLTLSYCEDHGINKEPSQQEAFLRFVDAYDQRQRWIETGEYLAKKISLTTAYQEITKLREIIELLELYKRIAEFLSSSMKVYDLSVSGAKPFFVMASELATIKRKIDPDFYRMNNQNVGNIRQIGFTTRTQ